MSAILQPVSGTAEACMRAKALSLSRRRALQLIGGASFLAAADGLLAQTERRPQGITKEQDAFLDELERRGCLFFLEQASQKTGQVRDRAHASGKENRRVASVAATGFGLTALCIAEKRAYIPSTDVRSRVRATLQFHLEQLPHHHGFYYHFSDMETGERQWECELSSVDTALLLCGVLTARAYFSDDAQIHEMATRIYERVDWPWMLNGDPTFPMEWRPERGFGKAHWDTYSELMMIYLLAIASPSHPIDPLHWDNFTRPYVDYFGFHYINPRAPLFIHQYSHAWFDFRDKRDRYADYFANSVLATRAHKAFCLSLGKPYTGEYWGVSASDSEHGYTAWGGPPMLGAVDGSVVPCAAAGSLPFLPADCLRVLMALRDRYGNYAWGRYGFCDALHPATHWYDADVLGIDQGISVVMAENLRTHFVWDTFRRNPEPNAAMVKVGFHTG